MADVRRTWQRPQLVILVRGNPEEDVLAKCKLGGRMADGGPQSDSFCFFYRCNQKRAN